MPFFKVSDFTMSGFTMSGFTMSGFSLTFFLYHTKPGQNRPGNFNKYLRQKAQGPHDKGKQIAASYYKIHLKKPKIKLTFFYVDLMVEE